MNTRSTAWLVAGFLGGFAASEFMSTTGDPAASAPCRESAALAPADAHTVGSIKPAGRADSGSGRSEAMLGTTIGDVPPTYASTTRRAARPGPEQPSAGEHQISHPADPDSMQRIADEAYIAAVEMADALAHGNLSTQEVEMMDAMADYAEFLASQAASADGQTGQSSADDYSPEQRALAATESLTAAGAPDIMIQQIEQSLLAPPTEPVAPDFDPRQFHADLPR